MKVITRAGWNARDPKNRLTVPWSTRTEFFVHHTDGPPTQTLRSIQDFHMGTSRGWSDIGYNFLVDDDGVIYEGRGWLVVGAHCPNHNRTGIGVAYIGENDPTDAAKRSIRRLYDEACRKAGRPLKKLGHGDRYPTECPGSKLQAWVNAGMPAELVDAPAKNPTEDIVNALPVLSVGADCYDVKTVRALLFARGGLNEKVYGGAVGLRSWQESTKYDAALCEDVKAFQRRSKLADDGVVGPLTYAALLRVS
ncbi:N-acetylmuramoyl-L-alanine amidase [Nonomuraea sp. NPDC003560]|uniref:N-acetylmuramoyl-L-alanine amidase n=1 Tax=Nonomuraea sp. NPDC003560 TaxID=3364341 RepID=UPI0036A3EFF6